MYRGCKDEFNKKNGKIYVRRHNENKSDYGNAESNTSINNTKNYIRKLRSYKNKTDDIKSPKNIMDYTSKNKYIKGRLKKLII